MKLVGKDVYVCLSRDYYLFGRLNYADEFSEKHGYRKPNYFYIENTSFSASHVRKAEVYENIRS